MLKLLKYELRKTRTSLLVMLIIAAVLFLMAPVGKWLKNEAMMVLSPSLLMFYALAAYIFVLVRGIGAYSGELKNRTGYLLLMTPHSPVTIVFSKLLFTLFFGLMMLVLCIAAMIGSAGILLGEVYEIKGFFNLVDFMLADTGIQLSDIGYLFAFCLIEIIGAVLSMVSVAYLSETLSATLLGGRRGRSLVSVLLFVLVYGLMSQMLEWVIPADLLKQTSMIQMLLTALPSVLLQLGFTAAFTTLSGVILKRWVSL